ncbi:exodeoxyribonuclease VII large subunit [Roseomonas sp. NAR14]|uniref:Exodeoxyribonuclease 7 large subunit n=1 Tax=Roseomonas acroporae TaxID=2937791 RepID=A0A9X1YD20_9PROT|nr:exodeoxyribonuclease VII large subunit [Roseomonas acroporae]MCK8786770.1 exodeoxyribonuclease VII large subunit [Roseomonas acroporae]
MDTLPPPESRSNLPEYAVSELSGAIKRTLEGAFGRVRVRGEITEMKRYPSGHIYLSLKDAGAKLEAVIWKGAVRTVGLAPENGVEVIATGRVTTYADRSKYQLSIERLEYAGEGALLARIEALRQRLLAEGLFDEGRKRRLPLLPEVIGVVTSERGAVFHDIRTTLARRFPRRLILWPVPVQGPEAAGRIAAAIAGFDALPEGGPVPRPDVLIVARGGGSLEDLMAFNEEPVLRAAAACRIPLISAVGHETDTTLIDHVSDRRAPTPTAAAEMAVPARLDLLAEVAHRGARLTRAAQAALERARFRLVQAERHLPDLPGMLATARQRLDDRAERLAGARLALVERRRAALDRLAARLPHPREVLADGRGRLGRLGERLDAAWRRGAETRRGAPALLRFNDAPLRATLREARTRLEAASARLESVSYQAVLARGFALVRDAEGEPVMQAAAVRPGQGLSLAFADGTVAVVAEGSGRAARGRRRPPAPEQEALL